MDAVEEIKRRLDVSEIVGSAIALKAAGANFKGLCPFHNEKTPSFMVSDEKGIWHCFGCGEGGDIFGFTMRMEGLDFPQALEKLAQKAGVTLPKRGQSKDTQKLKNTLYKILEMATRYYESALSKNQPAQKYLKERGLSAKTIKEFRMGFAPAAQNSLISWLSKNKVNKSDIQKAGLTRAGGNDLFRGRIIIPFTDSGGRVIGFTGRVIDDGMPKYLNTPATLLFDKGRFLFGLTQAKEAIRSNDEAVVTEGNMDVITSYQAGIKQVVATSGTAITSAQLKQLGRFSKNIKLAFDEDAAGINASERAIPIAQELGLALHIVRLGKAKDPDELIKSTGGKSKWQTMLKEAPYVVDWMLSTLPKQYDLNSALGKKQLTDRLMSTLNKLQDPVELEHYVNKVAKLVEASPEAIRRKLAKTDIKQVSRPAPEAVYHKEPTVDESGVVEDALLALAVTYADTRTSLQDIDINHFTNEPRVKLFEFLKSNSEVSLEKKLPKSLQNQQNYIKILLLKGEEDYRNWAALDRRIEAFSLAARLQNLYIKKLRNKLNLEIKKAEAKGDNRQKLKLLKEFRDLAAKQT